MAIASKILKEREGEQSPKYSKINLDNIEGSWKNSEESLGPKLIKEPTSVADKAKC